MGVARIVTSMGTLPSLHKHWQCACVLQSNRLCACNMQTNSLSIDAPTRLMHAALASCISNTSYGNFQYSTVLPPADATRPYPYNLPHVWKSERAIRHTHVVNAFCGGCWRVASELCAISTNGACSRLIADGASTHRSFFAL
jgi:hypothetical protein